MGLYDTFRDGKEEVQLKNFDCICAVYKKGDKISMKKYGYPLNGLFFCFVNPQRVVVIKKSIFIGIMNSRKALKMYKKMRIWNCQGAEYERSAR